MNILVKILLFAIASTVFHMRYQEADPLFTIQVDLLVGVVFGVLLIIKSRKS